MGNKISKISCGLLNKNGDSPNNIIIINSKPSSDLNVTGNTQLNTHKKLYTSLTRKNSIIEKNLSNIKDTFFIEDKDIENLYSFYSKKLLKNNKSKEAKDIKEYITKNDLYNLCHITDLRNEICPYLDHFWENINKSEEEKVYFDELLMFLISYCICSNYQLIEFVFGLIDKDNDKYISYEQIINLISRKYKKKEIFKYNHYEQILQYSSNKINRKDKINIDQFLIICLDNPFIFYPAIKLQNLLKNNYIGNSFWKKLNNKLTKNYTDSISKKEHLQLQNNIDDIRNKVISERIKSFKDKWKKEEEEKKKQEIYKEYIRLGPFRKNSDSNFFVDKFELREKNYDKKYGMLKLKKEKNLNKFLLGNGKNEMKSNDTIVKKRSNNFKRKLKKYKSTPNININKELLFFFIE